MKQFRIIRNLIIFSVTIFSILVFFVRNFLILITVENDSMLPALVNGNRILVIRHWPKKWYRKGQIVIVWPWLTPFQYSSLSDNDLFVKRIVCLPNDIITTSISELNPIFYPTEKINYNELGERIWYIPPNHIFVKGDAPIGGFDSQTWGPISFDKVIGLVIMKLN